MAFDDTAFARDALYFPDWAEVLAADDLPAAVQKRHRGEIVGFLRFCKQAHAPATVIMARQFLERSTGSAAREALRWLFRAGRAAGTPPRAGSPSGSGEGALERPAEAGWTRRKCEPAPAREDLGGADWERDLIVAVRRRGFLWRTETTYREWAVKFAAFLRPRSAYTATGEDVGMFLTQLAVTAAGELRNPEAGVERAGVPVDGPANAFAGAACHSPGAVAKAARERSRGRVPGRVAAGRPGAEVSARGGDMGVAVGVSVTRSQRGSGDACSASSILIGSAWLTRASASSGAG